MSVRPAVVDAHHHRAAWVFVRDPDFSAERQGLVGGRQRVGVELLAIGGALAVEAGAIPRGRTTLERLGVCCGDAPQRAPKDNASDGQKAGRFGHALWSPFDAVHNTTYCAATKEGFHYARS